jgi:hypothetical protein
MHARLAFLCFIYCQSPVSLASIVGGFWYARNEGATIPKLLRAAKREEGKDLKGKATHVYTP